MAISSTALNLNSLYTPPRTSPTLLSSSNSSLFTNTFKPLNLVHAHRSSKKTGLSVNCMFGLGVPELAVIAGVATLLFGPKALPEIGRNFGKTLKSFQQAAKEFETELKKDDPELLEESATAVNEMVDQENQDAKSTQVSL
ncbi:putative sec-independent protein translocase protein TatA/B/E [Helianthus annuus]|nr:putative sec-independent protein translocase protein TatA/B/E [Helianthus annuus]KAJ0888478.1 putative sec-independent protein translocase protein TatA/B/E [Helianthus annuus]